MPISKGSNFNAANPQTVVARLVDFGKGSPPVAGGSTARCPRPRLGANCDHAPAAVLYAAGDRLRSQVVSPRSAIPPQRIDLQRSLPPPAEGARRADEGSRCQRRRRPHVIAGTTTCCSPTPGPSPATGLTVLGGAGLAGEGGRAVDRETVRVPSPGRQLDVPPPPAPPPRRCRLCWAERVPRERGDVMSMTETLACHRWHDNLMFPHPRPLPRGDVACVGRSGSRGRGGTGPEFGWRNSL